MRQPSPRRTKVAAAAAGFALAAAGVVATALSTAPPAAAVASCLSPEAGALAAYETGSANAQDNIATRADMWIPGGPTDCQRISSIYVLRQFSSGQVVGAEFGVVVGWSSCTSNGYDDQKYGKPRLFYTIFNTNGEKLCKVYTARDITAETFTVTRISDGNQNGYWGPFFNGNELEPQGVYGGFSSGYSQVGMERGDPGDNGYARWNNLEEFTNGQWSQWDDVTRGVNNFDAKYFVEIINNSTVRIGERS